MNIRKEHLLAMQNGRLALVTEVDSFENIGIVVPIEGNDDDLREQITIVSSDFYGVPVIVENAGGGEYNLDLYRVLDFDNRNIVATVHVAVVNNPFLFNQSHIIEKYLSR